MYVSNPDFFSQNSLKTQVYVDITMRAAKDILGLVGFCFRVIPCVLRVNLSDLVLVLCHSLVISLFFLP